MISSSAKKILKLEDVLDAQEEEDDDSEVVEEPKTIPRTKRPRISREEDLDFDDEEPPIKYTQVPSFLCKLWRMVNDPSTDELIGWSANGKGFVIQNRAKFWYDLLPVYYKHNNMSSFVRQLNMYGFHKKSSLDIGDGDEIQFQHQYFQRNKPELLGRIRRKNTVVPRATHAEIELSPELTRALADVKALKDKQKNLDGHLEALKRENGVLWRELALLRQKHMKQQQIVNKLIQFLVRVVQPAPRMEGFGAKRQYQLMLNETPKSSGGLTIQEVHEDTAEENTTEKDTNEKDTTEKDTTERDFLDNLLDDPVLAGSYNAKAMEDIGKKTVATLHFDGLESQVDTTQGELEQLKDLLNGCTSLDANFLLGLFNEDAPSFGLSCNQNEQPLNIEPTSSGSELAKYDELIDLDQLLDDGISEEQKESDPVTNVVVNPDGTITIVPISSSQN